MTLSPEESLEKLRKGHEEWLKTGKTNDISAESVKCHVKGQSPYAVIITCSDSRVVPEAIFHAGTGDLFVIRTAGNTIGNEAMGSIEYAIDHLATRLVLILGHTHCGAVGAAMAGESGEYIRYIADQISAAVGNEKDPYQASCRNVEQSVAQVRSRLHNLGKNCFHEAGVCGAIFDIEDGSVHFIPD